MKTKLYKSFFLILLIGLLIFEGCKTTSSITENNVTADFTVYSGETPSKTATWHCIKIDLDTPGLELQLIPQDENYKSEYVATFAKKHKAKIVLNTTPFDLDNNDRLVGITKIDEKIITSAAPQYAALCFSKNPLRAHIIDSQNSEELENYPTATGGFFTILRGDKIYQFAQNKRSRSGAGLSHDGRYLYLFATTPKFNLRDWDGMTYEECAELMQSLGCTDAMQFDGGHSTGLYYNGHELEKPFLQRKVPSVIIIK